MELHPTNQWRIKAHELFVSAQEIGVRKRTGKTLLPSKCVWEFDMDDNNEATSLRLLVSNHFLIPSSRM
jgi:hypothetical protein